MCDIGLGVSELLFGRVTLENVVKLQHKARLFGSFLGGAVAASVFQEWMGWTVLFPPCIPLLIISYHYYREQPTQVVSLTDV